MPKVLWPPLLLKPRILGLICYSILCSKWSHLATEIEVWVAEYGWLILATHSVKAQLEIFHIFHFHNFFALKTQLWKYLTPFLLRKVAQLQKQSVKRLLKKASGQYSFLLLNPDWSIQTVGTSAKCKETETCPFSSPGPASLLTSGR